MHVFDLVRTVLVMKTASTDETNCFSSKQSSAMQCLDGPASGRISDVVHTALYTQAWLPGDSVGCPPGDWRTGPGLIALSMVCLHHKVNAATYLN